MQSNRHYQHLSGSFGCQPGNGLCQQAAKVFRRRMQPLVLERMDRDFQPAFVQPECNRAHKRRRRKAAGATKCTTGGSGRPGERVAAARARRPAEGFEFSPATFADWNRRKARQGGAAKSAKTRKDGTTNCVGGTSQDANHGAPARCLRRRKGERE